MGFPCICHSIVLPNPLAQLIQILHRIWFTVHIVFSYLGLYPSNEVDHAYYLPSLDLPTPTVTLSPTVIKNKLPVVEFASFYETSHRDACRVEDPTCVVCLGWLEARDDVRELGNCRHAFHKGCIDKWVDLGQFTCPLCRSQLLPSQGKGERGWRLNFLTRLR